MASVTLAEMTGHVRRNTHFVPADPCPTSPCTEIEPSSASVAAAGTASAACFQPAPGARCAALPSTWSRAGMGAQTAATTSPRRVGHAIGPGTSRRGPLSPEGFKARQLRRLAAAARPLGRSACWNRAARTWRVRSRPVDPLLRSADRATGWASVVKSRCAPWNCLVWRHPLNARSGTELPNPATRHPGSSSSVYPVVTHEGAGDGQAANDSVVTRCRDAPGRRALWRH
jgi:hypothetical protein